MNSITMKLCALLGPSALVSLLTLACMAQTPEDARREVDALRRDTRAAVAVLLDAGIPVAKRLAAVAEVRTVLDDDQVAAVKRLVANAEEPPEIRAAALERLGSYLAADVAFSRSLLEGLVVPKTPALLRREFLEAAQLLAFSGAGSPDLNQSLQSAWRRLLDDEDRDYREPAYRALCVKGDDVALGRLAKGLQDPAQAPLPPVESVRLLGLAPHGDHLPTLHALFRKPPDAATRLECIRLLGGYAPAQAELGGVLVDTRENEEARLAALGALHANTPERLAELALPVVRDERAPVRLRVYAIQAEMQRRSGLKPEAAALLAQDPFEAAVRAIAQREGAAPNEVSKAAKRYLERLRREG
jgi:hypothetical protein